jgi:hypothetical protein
MDIIKLIEKSNIKKLKKCLLCKGNKGNNSNVFYCAKCVSSNKINNNSI